MERKESALSMKIKIRKATEADISLARKYFTQMWVEHARHEPSLLSEKTMKNVFDKQRFKRQLRDKNYFIVVAEINGEFAGISRTHIEKIAPFFKNNKILSLDDSIVVKKFRRKGVRTALLREAEKFAKHKGARRIQAKVYTFNKPMQKLLEARGFKAPYMTFDKILS